MSAKRLNVGTIETLFSESDDEMNDADDVYIQLADETLSKKESSNVGAIELLSSEANYKMNDADDVYIQLAADRFENILQKLNKLNELPKSMFPNSDKQINKNRLKAIVCLKKKKMCHQKRDFLSEVFHNAEQWPAYILEILFAKEFLYPQRIALAAFFVGNGLIDACDAEKIYKIYNEHWTNSSLWNQRFREFRNLFSYLNKPNGDPDRQRIAMKYFYFNMITNTTLYLNGTKKN